MTPLPLAEWNKLYGGVEDNRVGEEFAPILIEDPISERVIGKLEELIGDFMWSVWDPDGKLAWKVEGGDVTGAIVQYTGKPCYCCGGYCGNVKLLDKYSDVLFEFDFSD